MSIVHILASNVVLPAEPGDTMTVVESNAKCDAGCESMTGQSPQPRPGKAAELQVTAIYARVREDGADARSAAARTVNAEMVRAYWLIGRGPTTARR